MGRRAARPQAFRGKGKLSVDNEQNSNTEHLFLILSTLKPPISTPEDKRDEVHAARRGLSVLITV